MRKLLFVIAPAVLVGIPATSSAIGVYGLSVQNQLVAFDTASPGTLTQSFAISGLSANESLVGIDFRPSNGMLYGVGNMGNVYTLNPGTGAASYVSTLFDSVTSAPLALNGVEFGVDFNPAADRLRVISNLGQNLRINVSTGATIVDGTINGPATFVVASAYTNNDNNPSTGTALFNIDSRADVLTLQNPPNNGTQVIVGSLGRDVTALAGMDIFTSGSGTNQAFAVLQTTGVPGSSLYTVDLASGLTTSLGSIGSTQSSDALALRDLALAPVPEPTTVAALGAGLLGFLKRRKSAKSVA